MLTTLLLLMGKLGGIPAGISQFGCAHALQCYLPGHSNASAYFASGSAGSSYNCGHNNASTYLAGASDIEVYLASGSNGQKAC